MSVINQLLFVTNNVSFFFFSIVHKCYKNEMRLCNSTTQQWYNTNFRSFLVRMLQSGHFYNSYIYMLIEPLTDLIEVRQWHFSFTTTISCWLVAMFLRFWHKLNVSRMIDQVGMLILYIQFAHIHAKAFLNLHSNKFEWLLSNPIRKYNERLTDCYTFCFEDISFRFWVKIFSHTAEQWTDLWIIYCDSLSNYLS